MGSLKEKTKKKLRKKFFRKPKKDFDDYNLAMAIANYRNLLYNISDEYEITAGDVSVLLWMYQFEFVDKNWILGNLRVGKAWIEKPMRRLIKRGFITAYSERFTDEQWQYINSDRGNYWMVDDVVVDRRYCLSHKGAKMCGEFIERMEKNPIVEVPSIENRGIEYRI